MPFQREKIPFPKCKFDYSRTVSVFTLVQSFLYIHHSKKGGFPMPLLYLFIAIWVSVNGITSPFDDILSFFMWAAVLVPVIAAILFLLHSDDDRKN